MTPASQLAVLVSERHVESVPLDLTLLCKELGLRMREVPAYGFDGALVLSKTAQKGIIAVNASLREKSRKRFTIAHEIGHFVLPYHRLLKTVCDEKKIAASTPARSDPRSKPTSLPPSSCFRAPFSPGDLISRYSPCRKYPLSLPSSRQA